MYQSMTCVNLIDLWLHLRGFYAKLTLNWSQMALYGLKSTDLLCSMDNQSNLGYFHEKRYNEAGFP